MTEVFTYERILLAAVFLGVCVSAVVWPFGGAATIGYVTLSGLALVGLGVLYERSSRPK